MQWTHGIKLPINNGVLRFLLSGNLHAMGNNNIMIFMRFYNQDNKKYNFKVLKS